MSSVSLRIQNSALKMKTWCKRKSHFTADRQLRTAAHTPERLLPSSGKSFWSFLFVISFTRRRTNPQSPSSKHTRPPLPEDLCCVEKAKYTPKSEISPQSRRYHSVKLTPSQIHETVNQFWLQSQTKPFRINLIYIYIFPSYFSSFFTVWMLFNVVL